MLGGHVIRRLTTSPRVVVADDHPLFRSVVAMLLGEWGWDVVAKAADGSEAIEAARRFRPALIVMDNDMPGVSGIEAARTIKARWPRIRVVILTGREDEADIRTAIQCGADGYLIKSAESCELESSLRRVLRGEPVFPAISERV